jgi:hypothetical protein
MSDTTDEDLDWAESENVIEELTILELISEHGIEPNLFNTMDWINNFYTRTQKPTTELMSETLVDLLQINPEYRRKIFETTLESVGLKEIERLVQQYKLIGERMEYLLPYEKNLDSDNPLDIFLFDISCGSYPPPEIIMMLAKCFNLYFLAEGKLTLEEVFFGKIIKKSGNYSRRKARNNSFKEFHYQVIKEKGNSKYIGPKFVSDHFKTYSILA